MIFRSLSAASLLTLAAAVAQAAPASRDTMIVPGQRIGPLSLGASLGDLIMALGPPGETLHQGDVTVYAWGPLAAEMNDKAPGIESIIVTDDRYETDGHVHVGLAALAVAVVLGPPQNETSAAGLDTWEYDGMSVVLANNMVVQIRVRK